MKLTGRVVKLESGKDWTDGIERVTIRVKEAGQSMYAELKVPNADELRMDDEVLLDVTIFLVPEPAGI